MCRVKKRHPTTREAIDYPIDQIKQLGILIDEIERKELTSRGQRDKHLPDFHREEDITEEVAVLRQPRSEC